MNEVEWQLALGAMRDAGRRDGKAAASWVVDGNTSDGVLRTILRQWEEGDPAAPTAPSPFSGEWADDPTPENMVNRETAYDAAGLDPESIDELAAAYEEAYAEAWYEEAERTVRGLLGPRGGVPVEELEDTPCIEPRIRPSEY